MKISFAIKAILSTVSKTAQIKIVSTLNVRIFPII